MTRYGPLHTVSDGISISAPEDRHVRLTADGVRHQHGDRTLDAFGWDEIAAVELRLPGSPFPFIRAASSLGYALLTLVSQQVEVAESTEGTVRLTLRDGRTEDLHVDNAIGGYWRRSVAAAETLARQFVDDAAKRVLLRHPDEVMRRYVTATRWRPGGVA